MSQAGRRRGFGARGRGQRAAGVARQAQQEHSELCKGFRVQVLGQRGVARQAQREHEEPCKGFPTSRSAQLIVGEGGVLLEAGREDLALGTGMCLVCAFRPHVADGVSAAAMLRSPLQGGASGRDVDATPGRDGQAAREGPGRRRRPRARQRGARAVNPPSVGCSRGWPEAHKGGRLHVAGAPGSQAALKWALAPGA